MKQEQKIKEKNMKKELSKILRNFEGQFTSKDENIEFELYECACCGDWTGRIVNHKSQSEWSIDIEDTMDMMEFDNVFSVVTGAPFFGLVGIIKEIKEKKFNKLIDDFYELADVENEKYAKW